MKELRDQPRWLVWKREKRDDKWTKVPYNPHTGKLASTTDPSTWGKKSDADIMLSAGFDGIGAVIDDPYTAIDIDHCIENGKILPWAKIIIDSIDSYTELSPSGEGVHVWVKHRLPGLGRKRAYETGALEMYDRARYFTVTDQPIPGSTDIVRERDVDWLYELIDSVPASSRVGVKPKGRGIIARAPVDFDTLFRGDWQTMYSSQSEADLALCGLLFRKYGNDEDKVDEEFRKSGLYRDKWERDDYRKITLKKAMGSKPAFSTDNSVDPPNDEPEGDPNTISVPDYPVDIWDGTPYAMFAQECAKGSIPYEWLVEALKTAVGALMGNRVRLNVQGGIPRFYTMIIGQGGLGKGTVCNYIHDMFNGIVGTKIGQPLLWGQNILKQDIQHKYVGACVIGFGSAQGMQRALSQEQNRWLQIYEEFSGQAESFKIEGSGQGLLGANRQMYDGEHFTTTAIGSRDSFYGKAQNSILGGCTRELWNDMFSGQSVEGSGLFQRFNLIPNESTGDNSVPLRPPNLDPTKERIIPRIYELENAYYDIEATDAAIQAVIDWRKQFVGQELTADDKGRLDILAWRNAIHLAFWNQSHTISVNDIKIALLLSDYQFKVRRLYRPTSGDNHIARLENAIIGVLQTQKKEITMSVLMNRTNAFRYGTGTFNKALTNCQLFRNVQVRENPKRKGYLVKLGL